MQINFNAETFESDFEFDESESFDTEMADEAEATDAKTSSQTPALNPVRVRNKTRQGGGGGGRWFRKGRNIVLLLNETATDQEGEVGTGRVDVGLNVFIHPNIDVDAQRALMAMASSYNVAEVNAAYLILDMVRDGTLAGLYKPDQKVPALMFKAWGWWTLLGPGEKSALYCVPGKPGQAIFIFRKHISRHELIAEMMGSIVRNGRAGIASSCGAAYYYKGTK